MNVHKFFSFYLLNFSFQILEWTISIKMKFSIKFIITESLIFKRIEKNMKLVKKKCILQKCTMTMECLVHIHCTVLFHSDWHLYPKKDNFLVHLIYLSSPYRFYFNLKFKQFLPSYNIYIEGNCTKRRNIRVRYRVLEI